jgi:hypothetical protein
MPTGNGPMTKAWLSAPPGRRTSARRPRLLRTMMLIRAYACAAI